LFSGSLGGISEDYDVHIFGFGQVDVEIGIHYRRFVKGQDVGKDFLKELAGRYVELIANNCKKPVIKGCNLSVIKYKKFAAVYIHRIIARGLAENESKNILSELRSNVPSYLERNRDIIYFNKCLRAFCKSFNVEYFDINDELSDGYGGVSEKFIPSGFDHHLIDSLYIRKLHVDRASYIV